MVTIEPHEVEIFRRYFLNPEKVGVYRQRLACEPPLPLKELRAYKRKLAALVKRMEATANQIKQFDVEMESFRVTWDWSPGDMLCLGDGRGVWTLEWDLENERWGKGYKLSEKCNPTYTTRPDKPEALRAWNLFLIAFRAEPKRLGRQPGYTSYDSRTHDLIDNPACYCAEYLDRNGEPLTIAESSIRLHRSKSPKSVEAYAESSH